MVYRMGSCCERIAMAKITVRMFATVREASGASSCELEASDLGDLFSRLITMYGPRLGKMLDSVRTDQERLVVLVNGNNAVRKSLMATKLSNGDEVAIFPPVSGG